MPAAERPRLRSQRVRRRRLLGAAVVAALAAALAVALLTPGRPERAERQPAPTTQPPPPEPPRPPPEDATAPADGPGQWPLSWPPPHGWRSYQELHIPAAGGRFDLEDRQDYRVVAPETVTGSVDLRGGRNIVWIGGHINLETDEIVSHVERLGVVVRDVGHERRGRVVHLEGLLIDGSQLSEGLNVAAPSAVVQIQNVRIETVRFRSRDDRDGTGKYAPFGRNHPDIVQPFGGFRELRIDGLTGQSSYQGLFFKVDHADGVGGPAHLRRIDVKATVSRGADGRRFAGSRMYFFDTATNGDQYVDRGTVWVDPHPAIRRPDAVDLAELGAFVAAVEQWHLAEEETRRAPLVGRDAIGTYLEWPVPDTGAEAAVLDRFGREPGRVYAGRPPGGSYVPPGVAGPGYETPGYLP